MQRRKFLQAAVGSVLMLPGAISAVANAAGKSSSTKQPFFARNKLPIGVQLHTLEPDLEKDFAGTLAALRKLGYETVELAGLHGRTAAEVRAAFDAAGLRCPSAHIQGTALGPGLSLDGDLNALAETAHTIGFSDVVMPLFQFPKDFKSPAGSDSLAILLAAAKALTTDDYRGMADFLNAKGQALKALGLHLAYHNHNIEFRRLPSGETAYELLLRQTDRKLVSFEMDAGWAAAAGQDPAALLRANPGRFTALHVKDIKGSTMTNYEFRQIPTEVGSGMINWAEILPIAAAQRVTQYYVEQEPPFPGTRLDSVRKSYRYLSTLTI